MRRSLLAVLLAVPLVAQEAYQETIDVVRYIVPARVVDYNGRAIRGLTAADFTAAIGGKTAEVESVEWIGSGEPAAGAQTSTGRLVVVFMQTDFARNSRRVVGQMKFNAHAATILGMLEPEDWVAVVSQDSHLKLQCEFTRDRERAREAIYDAFEIRRVPLPPAPESGPSLARSLSDDEMRRTGSPGVALRMIAHALQKNEGEKVVIVGGWGIGELVNRRVLFERAWIEAMQLYRASRTPVITLGIGGGGSLTYGLVATAKETGGIYATTQEWIEQSLTRLRGVLSGYYELVLRVDAELPPGEHRVELKTQRKGANVLAAPLTVFRTNEPGVNEIVELPDPDPAPPAVSAGRLYVDALQKLRDGDAEAAEALLTRAIDLGGAPEDSWYERALLRAARGAMAPAADDLRAYLERAPRGKRAAEARELLGAW